MRLFKYLLITVIFCCALQANSQSRQTDAPPPPPPPANDYFPKNWKPFSSVEGRFEVLFPGTPQKKHQVTETATGKTDIYFFIYSSFINYSVMYADFPSNIEESGRLKQILDGAQNGGLMRFAKFHPVIIKESDISVNERPGRFLHFKTDNGFVFRMKMIVAKNRLYTLLVMTPTGEPNTMGSANDYEEIALSFIDSFRLKD